MKNKYHGGETARKYRREVVALAQKQKESVRTLKFPLECVPEDFNFSEAAKTYGVTEGVKKGSLFGFLCAVHLSGFRMFSKGGKTQQFRNSSRYPTDEFADALLTHTGIDNRSVTIQAIEGTFGSPPRKKGGVAPEWSANVLAHRLFQEWEGRSPNDTDADQPTYGLAEGIAQEVFKNEAFKNSSDWKELKNNVTEAMACADRHLATLGDFPKLGNLPSQTGLTPKNCTVAYDAQSPYIQMNGNEKIWIHQVVAVCAARLRREKPDLTLSSSKFATELQSLVVTSQNNGLSWLFGKGLCYFREASLENIAADLRVPEAEIHRVRQLKEFADAIPKNSFFAKDSYPEFRTSVGGKISSWVASYWKRLEELSKLHSSSPNIEIPQKLLLPENEYLFSGQHTDATSLKDLCEQLPQRIKAAKNALEILRGDDVPELTHIETIKRVADYVSALIGQIEMLNNRIKQEMERNTDKKKELEKLHVTNSAEPKNKPPKLNRISGGSINVDDEIKQLETDFNNTLIERREHYQRLTEGNQLDPLPSLIEHEHKLLVKKGEDEKRAEEQAVRRILHQLAEMSRRLSLGTKKVVQDRLKSSFLKKKDANKFFYNRQGTLYKSPFSTSRHRAYDIDLEHARQKDWLLDMENLLANVRRELSENGNKELLKDLILIEEFCFNQRLKGLPEKVSRKLATPESEVINIPPLLAAQLKEDKVPRDAAIRVFNLFNGVINGLRFNATRQSFINRVKFTRAEREELFYAPKDKLWHPPETYRSAKGMISKGLEHVQRDKNGAVLPKETAQHLSKSKFPEGARELLQQLPHDWFVELNIHGEPPKRAGLPIKTEGKATGIGKRYRNLGDPAFRLIGPPSFKTCLDRALTNDEVKLGDYTLLISQHYKQTLRMNSERIHIDVKLTQTRAEIAVPVIDKRPYQKSSSQILFDNFVAIDLGEKRIGYAVFSLKDLLEDGVIDPKTNENGKPLTGTVAIPIFRKLMTRVRQHRGQHQPNQKIGLTYSRALEQFRENAVGDICRHIDTLCKDFNAFPVLESSVGNFESGGNQLKMIYGSVLDRYTFPKTDAHKAKRAQYWQTGKDPTWEHPYIMTHKWNKTKKEYSGKPQPLNIFPGAKVHPAGTSQKCHHCERNAVTELREMPDKIKVKKGGKIKLPNGVITLYKGKKYSEHEWKKFRREKHRPPFNEPVSKGSHKRDELEKILKRNMRQPPKSEMSPDTTQARFVCVYENCDYDGHADENAAINIGRKFIREKIDIEKSKAKMKKSLIKKE